MALLSDILDTIKTGSKIEAVKLLRDTGLEYPDNCVHGWVNGHFEGMTPAASDQARSAGVSTYGREYCRGASAEGLGLKQAKEIVEILMGTHAVVLKEEATKTWDRQSFEARLKDAEDKCERFASGYGEMQDALDNANAENRRLKRQVEGYDQQAREIDLLHEVIVSLAKSNLNLERALQRYEQP